MYGVAVNNVKATTGRKRERREGEREKGREREGWRGLGGRKE